MVTLRLRWPGGNATRAWRGADSLRAVQLWAELSAAAPFLAERLGVVVAEPTVEADEDHPTAGDESPTATWELFSNAARRSFTTVDASAGATLVGVGLGVDQALLLREVAG
jgi:hypothetical protein|tara:strand:- start:237 stop:569 length:333 start_codon:yes stop_codon:yes gene_type:complete